MNVIPIRPDLETDAPSAVHRAAPKRAPSGTIAIPTRDAIERIAQGLLASILGAYASAADMCDDGLHENADVLRATAWRMTELLAETLAELRSL